MKSNKQSNADRELKKLQDDLEFCNMAIEMSPDDDNAHYNKGEVLRKMSLFDESYVNKALDSYNQAINLNPENVLALCDRSKLLVKMGKGDAAINDLKLVRELTISEKSVIAIYARNVLKELDQFENINKSINAKIHDLSNPQKAEPIISEFQNISNSIIKINVVEKIQCQLRIEDETQKLKMGSGNEDLIKFFQAQVAEKDKAVNDALARLIKLESQVSQNNVDINAVKEATTILSTRVDKIESVISSIKSKIDENFHNIATIVDEYAKDKTKLKLVQDQLMGLSKKFLSESKLQKEQMVLVESKLNAKIEEALKSTQQVNQQVDVQSTVNGLIEQMKMVVEELKDIKSEQNMMTDTALDNAEQIGKLKAQLEQTTIKYVVGVTYDNKILNHPDLANYIAKHVGMNKVLDLGEFITNDLIDEAIQSHNYDIALAGIMSIDNSGVVID
jgi:tetratricopeptide (TPR) repeat protein